MQVHQLLRQGSVLLIAIVLAKSPLSAADIGAYEMLFFVASALTFFWITGLNQGLLSLYPRISPGERAGFLSQSYLLFLGVNILLAGGVWWWQSPVLQFLTGQHSLPVFGAFLLFLLLYQPTYLLEHFYLAIGRPRMIVVVSVASAVLQITAVAIPAFAGWGLPGIVNGLLLFALIRHGWLAVFIWRSGAWPGWERRRLAVWLNLSLPLILYALLGGFHTTFDNWLVGRHFAGDEYQFAIFRYGARELPLAMALAGALGIALLPNVAASVTEALPEVRKHTLRLFHYVFPPTIALLLTSQWWFPRVFSSAFAPAIPIFNLFLLLVISRVVPSRTILMGLHDNRSILWISIIELGVHVAVSWVLVSEFGLLGIAIGTLVAFVLEKLLHCLYLYRRYGIAPGRYMNLGWLAGYSTLLAFVYWYTLTF